jgi:hypothetical protein
VFVRSGWIWSSDLAHGEGTRRVVRGDAPALSPDGRSLAYVGGGHHVFVIALRGGKPRQVGHLQARTLDWGPAPRGAGCSLPSRQLIARSGQAAVWQQTWIAGDTTVTAVSGCVFGVAIRRSLAVITDTGGTSFSLGPVALAGNYVAMELADGEYHRIEGPDNVVMYDLRTGGAIAQSPTLCPFQNDIGSACAQVDSLQITTRGFSAWHQFRRPGGSPAIPIAETVDASDDTGVRTLDSVPDDTGHSLTQIHLGPDSVTWLHDGVPRSAPLK